jgi:hypothetical protein
MTTFLILKQSVDSWLLRDDVAVSNSEFSTVMLLAEAEIATDLRCVVQETSVDLVFTGRSEDLPADYLVERNPFIDDNIRKIAYMTPKQLRETGPWQTGRSGSFYTLEGGGGTPPDDRVQMTIAAAASVADPLTITVNYYKRFAALVNDGDTNWLLQNHFNVYLYATLRASAEYIQEDMLEDRFKGKYEEAKEKLVKHENRKRYGVIPKQSYGSPRGIV